MLLTFQIFGRARNHGKKFLKLRKTSFIGIVHYAMDAPEIILECEIYLVTLTYHFIAFDQWAINHSTEIDSGMVL